MTHEQPTKQDILDAINSFATSVEIRFQSLESKVSGTNSSINGLENRVGGLEKKVISIEDKVLSIDGRLVSIENKMVTKDYLDDKLYDLRGDLISLTRKEDEKLGTLVQILKKRKVINPSEAKQILKLEPFAR